MGIIDRLRFWKDSKEAEGDVSKASEGDLDHQEGRKVENHGKASNLYDDRKRDVSLRRDLDDLQSFTVENFRDVASELEYVRSEIDKIRQEEPEVQKKMFKTLQKTVKRYEELEKELNKVNSRLDKKDKRIERLEDEKEGLKSLEKGLERSNEVERKVEQIENKFDNEIARLEKQKVDGKDLVNISQAPQSSQKVEKGVGREEKRSRIDLDSSQLTKKQRAKLKILELLKEGKVKSEIREEVEGDICSRQWFYDSWDELENEAYISGRGEALIHPEDYKKEITS